MTTLLIDEQAIELIARELTREKASAMRIFTAGGGCCKRFEIIPVEKALVGDQTFVQGGIRIFVEKEIAENTSGIHIKYDEHKGLLLDLT